MENTAIEACANAVQWQQAVYLLLGIYVYRILHMIPDISALFDFGGGSAFDLNSKSDQQSCSLGHIFLFRNY